MAFSEKTNVQDFANVEIVPKKKSNSQEMNSGPETITASDASVIQITKKNVGDKNDG